MNWLDKLKGKIGRPDGAAAHGADKPRQGPDREVGGTVLRAGARPGTTIAKPGVRFKPKYEVTVDLQIKTLLGSGGMGEVYLARQRQWDVDVAVKVPSDEIVSDPENRHRIVREAEAWTDLGLHPNIAYCYYVQPLGDLLLLVIEYVDGGNLRDWIVDGRCADLKTGLDLAIQFCHGLEHAHNAGLVHRDIKPENVLLTQDGMLKITDFGIVHKARTDAGSSEQGPSVANSAPSGMTVAGMGTDEYMPPEQWQVEKEIDLRADIFAFGVCIYEMLCGHLPYPRLATAGAARLDPPEPVTLRGARGLPDRLCRLMKRCVDWEQKNRPSDAREVRAELCTVYEEAFGEPSLHAELPALQSLADHLNNRAISYLQLGRREEAEKLFDQALAMDPVHPQATYNRGLHLWRTGRQTDVAFLSRLEELQRFRPGDWNVPYFLGLIHLERQDADGALAALAAAEKLNGAAEIQRALAEAKRCGTYAVKCLRTFEGVRDVERSLVMTSDGRLALSGSGRDLRLWEVSSGKCLKTFEGHTDDVTSVVLSPDGSVALSGSRDGTLRLWEVSSGKCLKTFEGRDRWVWSVALSADGLTGLSSHSRTLRLWDVSSGNCVRVIEVGSHVASVALSADGSWALSGGKQLRLWDVSSGRCLRDLDGHTDQVNALALSGDGRLALSGSGVDPSLNHDNTLRLWDISSGSCLRTLEGHVGMVEAVALSTDVRWALSGGGLHDNTLRLWDVGSGKCLRSFGLGRGVTSVVLSTDNRFALSAGYDNELRLWDVSGLFDRRQTVSAPWALCQMAGTKKTLAVQERFHALLKRAAKAFSERDFAAAWSSAVESRALQGYQFSAEALDMAHQAGLRGRRTGLRNAWCPRTVIEHGERVTAVALSADGRLAVSGSSALGGASRLRLWETKSGRCLKTLDEYRWAGDINKSVSVTLSADGGWVLAGDHSGTIWLWETSSDRCFRVGEDYQPRSLALSADRRWVLSPGLGGTLHLWEVCSGKCVRKFQGHTVSVHSVALSADARWALSGSMDRTVRLWEVSSGRCIRVIEGHKNSVESIALCPDGRYALSIEAYDGAFRLWDVGPGVCLRTFTGHNHWLQSVALSADGRWALSGSLDHTVRLWEVSTGKCIKVFQEHTDSVNSVALSADGRWALSGSSDETLRLWELEWNYEFPEEKDWDEGARPHLESFLTLHTPYVSTDPDHPEFLLRRGRPSWEENDWLGLVQTLQYAGYGWLRPEGVRRELEKMAAEWQGPPPLPWEQNP